VLAQQPRGAVTLLFSDIEGSTRLLQSLGTERYAAVLDRHRELLRAAFSEHGGYEVDCEGDAFFVAFAGATAAVEAATEAQQALARELWPEGVEVRVRMGLHSGEPLAAPPKYVGLDVHRAARIMAAGHGGQVLVSEAARKALADDAALLDCGRHRLKDLLEPERLFQLAISGAPSEFPPLRSLGNRPTNLPVQPNSLIGRERELEELEALLVEDGGVRLLTLTGPGGVGKTRLALHAAAESVERFDDGVFFVPLEPLRDAALVVPAIAQTLAFRELPAEELESSLASYLHDKRVLLVLDNFEQVIDAALSLGRLLKRCPGITLLVTSRERLRLAGERVYPVPPLRLPEQSDRALLAVNEAVSLFVARALAATGDFALTERNASDVVAICRQLDGLPLAIELAAARTTALTPEAILKRLGRGLELLTGGPRDLEERQQTLRSTIAWSFDLLGPDEQLLFARLAVFVDGCTPEAARAVCDPNGELGLDPLDGLSSLLEKNLLRRRREDVDGDPRFWMLATIRDYARERLVAMGCEAELRERHAAWALGLVEREAAAFHGPDQVVAYERLGAEQANIRAALGWAVAQDDPDRLLRLVLRLTEFWVDRDLLREAQPWLDQTLSRLGPEATVERASVLKPLVWIALQRGDVAAAKAYADERRAVADALGDPAQLAGALTSAALIAEREEDYARAYALQAECVALRRRIPDKWALATSLANLGAEAEPAGELAAARAAFEEALELYAELGEPAAAAEVQQNLAWVTLNEGAIDDAERLWLEALPVLQTAGYPYVLRSLLSGLASVSNARGDPVRGTRLMAAVVRSRAESGEVLDPGGQKTADDRVATLRAQLPPKDFAAAWAEGEALSLDEAIDYALGGKTVASPS
jgi:predicted ATPase/class 3 adenylate cyclase